MTDHIETLEAAAIRTRQAAGRAWADLQACKDDAKRAEMQANYDMAVRAQDEAYNAWKAA